MALKHVKDLPRNEAGIQTVLDVMRQRYGDAFQTGLSLREQHAHTTTYIPNQKPDGVFFAESEQEIADVVRICADHKVPVIPYGTGTSLEGHVNAPSGGISIDTVKMNKILAVYPEDLNCVIQPGVTREALNTHLRDQGLFFPIDPGANASLGGMAATSASGTNAVLYGTMRDNVIGLKAVTANGETITTSRRVKKTSAGYDLTRLFVGSEGTLGVITELTLKLQGIPQGISGGVCMFPSVETACQATIATIQMGIPVARIELVNTLQMQAMIDYSKLDYQAQPCLFLEFHGTENSVTEQAELFGEIAEEFGGGPFRWTTNTEERNQLWKARHDAYWAALGLRPGAKGISTDVCVPISRLAECVAETEKDIDQLPFPAPIVGHIGDGNFHSLLLIDDQDEAEVALAEAFVERLTARALGMGGTCTGEHGIGQGKMPYLREELGGAVDVMVAIKKALDPDNIMNPGKMFEV